MQCIQYKDRLLRGLQADLEKKLDGHWDCHFWVIQGNACLDKAEQEGSYGKHYTLIMLVKLRSLEGEVWQTW